MKRSFKEVQPDMLIVTDNTVLPSRAMVESVKMYGIIEPLIVVPKYKRGTEEITGYEVKAGVRRYQSFVQANEELDLVAQLSPETKAYQKYADILARRKQTLSTLPVLIYVDAGAEIGIITNVLRAKNPLHELELIEEIMARMMKSDGAASQKDIEKEITRTTGMTAATIRARLRWQNLIPELRALVAAGKMSPGVAERAARLKRPQQKKLLRKYDEKLATLEDRATITGADISEITSIEVKRVSGELFAGLNMSAPSQ